MTSFRLHFDNRSWDAYFKELWARRLARLPANSAVQVTTDPAAADAIIDLTSAHALQTRRSLALVPGGYFARWPERTFEWDFSDFPSGRLPGFYCSLSRRLFDPSCHRSFCYPWRYNEAVRERPSAEAEFLYGFSGSASSSLRHRLLAVLGAAGPDGMLRGTDTVWHRMFAGGEDPAKQQYADDLARAKFILCPRGNGLSSIRLFEAMETGRVPVILSDDLVLPQCVDWTRCSVRIAERDLARIPQLLADRAGEWQELAREARRQWEANFSDSRLLDTLATECRFLLAQRHAGRRPRRWSVLARILPEWTLFRAQAARRKIRHTLKRTMA